MINVSDNSGISCVSEKFVEIGQLVRIAMPRSKCALDGPANALAVNSNRDSGLCAVAGRTVFKVFNVDDQDRIVEKMNLRVGKNINLNYSCSDVVWNPEVESLLATAATNGAVVIWDLNKGSKCKQEFVLADHKRTVNRVVFQDGNTLLSGSQDGTMKCFDLRRKEVTRTYVTSSESVRDIKFSPHEVNSFAAVQENGNVQIWDWRRSDRCIRQFTAHSGPVFSCDWHTEDSLLATGGRDKTIRVWNMQSTPTLVCTIYTIASVANIRWRPNHHYQIASTSQVLEQKINIWDIRRMYVPLFAFAEHKDVVTGCAFRSQGDTLLSTGKDSMLILRTFDYAIQPAAKANPVAHRFNSEDSLALAMWDKLKANAGRKMAKSFQASAIPVSSGLGRKGGTPTPAPAEDTHTSCRSDLTVIPATISNLYHRSFTRLALTYRLCGATFNELCEHNAKCATEVGLLQVAQTWRILRTLFPTIIGEEDATGKDPIMQRSFNDEKALASSQDETSRHNSVTNSHRSRHPSFKDDDDTNSSGGQGDGIDALPKERATQGGQSESSSGSESDDEQEKDDDDLSESDEYSEDDVQEAQEMIQHSSFYPQPRSKFLTVISIPSPPARLEPEPVIIEAMLRQCVDQGDVQSAVSMALVLGKRIRSRLPVEDRIMWINSYLELLSRFELWNVHNQVIILSSDIEAIRVLNQQSTTVHAACDLCDRPLTGYPLAGFCKNCDRFVSKCSICYEVIEMASEAMLNGKTGRTIKKTFI
ncbi:GATOR complex protein WDR24-like isoform X2 [Varroa jacobsoni]|uniref:GATOR2 complex protein WDR24 n=1 Tax=Varroa destructor TaxID=109461 RepID=A0A7M7JUW1_VARDE|nr:GATOR complex protein WDR24-like isoform X2 [Varroa destructor]XP_022704869.1 GATOR complex protein WDR24-like isoform X2 [Varroa jacobsoni]